MTRQFLVIPTASATTERVFSFSGLTGDGTQTRYAQVPFVKHIPIEVRQTIQSYLNLGEDSREVTQDWSTSRELAKCQERHNVTPVPSREMGQRIADLIHEPAHQTVLELEEIKELLDTRTPIK